MTLNKWRKSTWRILVLIGILAIIGIGLRSNGPPEVIKGIYQGKITEKAQSATELSQIDGQDRSQMRGEISGQVVQVKDGDSFIMSLDADNSNNASNFPGKSEIEVRLSSIDAPEYFQPFGQECRRELSNIIGSQKISIKPETKDKYGRTIAVAYIANINVNREMVRRGCAWAYLRYLNDFSMRQLEQDARRQKLLIWSQEPSNIKPPWQERKEH